VSHYDNEYYILVVFCVNKARDHFDSVCLLAFPHSSENFKFIGQVYKCDRQEEVPRIFQLHNFQEIIYLGHQVDEERLPRPSVRKGL